MLGKYLPLKPFKHSKYYPFNKSKNLKIHKEQSSKFRSYNDEWNIVPWFEQTTLCDLYELHQQMIYWDLPWRQIFAPASGSQMLCALSLSLRPTYINKWYTDTYQGDRFSLLYLGHKCTVLYICPPLHKRHRSLDHSSRGNRIHRSVSEYRL